MSKKIKSQSEVSIDKKHANLKHLSNDELKSLQKSTPEQVEQFFANYFKLNDFEYELYQACLLDFYVTQYWWISRANKYSSEQVAVYFKIIQELIENLKEKHMKLNDNILAFKELLVDLNEKSFTEEQLIEIVNHLTLTFFQNYKLLEYTLNESRQHIVLNKQIEVECPKPVNVPYPAPLDESMPDNRHRKYILKIEDEPSPEELYKQQIEQEIENIHVEAEVIKELQKTFGDIEIDDAKRIIYEVTQEMLDKLKNDMKVKIKEVDLANETSKTTAKKSKN